MIPAELRQRDDEGRDRWHERLAGAVAYLDVRGEHGEADLLGSAAALLEATLALEHARDVHAEAIVQAREQGLSFRELATLAGMTPAGVRKAVIRGGAV